MALVFNDRVKETSVTTGTGTLTLDGAVQGFETFSSAIGNSNTTYYAIELPGTTEFEVGRGTVSAGQLARTQVISSSNSDSPVDFSAGTKIVFCTLPASKAVIKDASGNIPIDANKTIEFGDSGETISGDGTQLNIVSSNKVLIDAETDIHLDANGTGGAGGGDILFQDNGVTWLKSSNNTAVEILSTVSDKDLSIRGNDGGSEITALTFDMSEAGAATFNDNVSLGSGKQLKFHTVGDNIKFDGTNLLITATNGLLLDGDQQIMFNDGGVNYGAFVNSSTRFTLHSQRSDVDFAINVNDGGSQLDALFFDASEAGAATFNSTVTANAGVIVDNITIDGTEIDLSSGDLTLDVAGDIILNADGGDWIFRDGSTELLKIFNASSDVSIKAQAQDKDLKFLGNDGGSGITALTLDMSEAGAATFNDKIILGANKSIEFGDSGETISGDGTDLTIASSGFININASSDVKLNAAGNDIRLYSSATEFLRLTHSSGDAIINSLVSDKDIKFQGNDGGSTITPMMIDMSAGGRVGIGTTTPLAPLHIDDSGGAFVRLTRTGFSGYLQLATAGGTGSLSVDGANTLNLRTNDTNHLSINGSGNVTVETGTFTADQGVIVDNITIDGTEIDLSSGDLTIDVAGDITLDADGGDIIFADASTEIGRFTNDSTDFAIQSSVQDKDLIFKGNDGGSTIEAMRIDMSEGGRIGIGTSTPARDLQIAKSTSGGTVRLEVNNESNTGSSHGVISIYSGGTSGGDPYLHFKVDNGEQYSIGIDNDQSDALVFSNGFGVGSNNLLSIATDGSATFTGTVTANGEVLSAGVSAGFAVAMAIAL
jgi:hypothetical protein